MAELQGVSPCASVMPPNWSSDPVRLFIDGIVSSLVARHRASGRVELDDLDEAIGSNAVSYDEVDHIIERLEAEGLRVAEPLTPADIVTMRGIVEVARSLRARLQRTPTVAEIEAESGRPAHEVRRALQAARRIALSTRR